MSRGIWSSSSWVGKMLFGCRDTRSAMRSSQRCASSSVAAFIFSASAAPRADGVHASPGTGGLVMGPAGATNTPRAAPLGRPQSFLPAGPFLSSARNLTSHRLQQTNMATQKDLVVLLPGITGSVLSRKKANGKVEDVWGVSGSAIFGIVKSLGGSLKDLKVTND